MPSRPCKCCCWCQIAENEWTDTTFDETFEFMRNVTSASTAIAQITDDGTTLGCKKYDASKPMTTPLIANESPSLEIDSELVYTMATPPAYDPGGGFIQLFGYQSVYIFGQILPATAVNPDGHPMIVNLSIDWAARYRDTTRNSTGVTTVHYDASIPTVTAGGGDPQPQLAARQCGQIFLLRSGESYVEGRTGLQYTESSSFPSNVAGDWYRLVASDAPHGFNVNLSADRRWEIWNNPTTLNTGFTLVPAYPNFCAGADPIEFGWFVEYNSTQQTQYVGSSGVLIDLRTSESRFRMRIDRLCINVVSAADNLCSCWDHCFDLDLPTIVMQRTEGIIQCGWTLLASTMVFRNAINWSTDPYQSGGSDGTQCEFVAGYATITATSGSNSASGNAKLWTRLGDSHAIIRLRVKGVDSVLCVGERNETIRWYCSNNFNGSTGTFFKSNLSDTGGDAAVASNPWTWANLAAFNAAFHNASFTLLTADGMPSSITIGQADCSLCTNDGCCDPPPATITVSVAVDGSGGCYTGVGTFTLPRVPSGGVESRWAGDDDESTAWVIKCIDGVWSIDAIDVNLTMTGAVSASCDPFEIIFEKTSGACFGTIVTVTV